MATELVRWCDWHISDDGQPRVVGSAHTVALDGVEYDVDLCDDCTAKHLDPLAGFVAAFGRKVGKTAAAGATGKKSQRPQKARDAASAAGWNEDGSPVLDCPHCDFTGVSRTALAVHATKAHDIHGLDALFPVQPRS